MESKDLNEVSYADAAKGTAIKNDDDLISVLNTFDNYAEMSDNPKKYSAMKSAIQQISKYTKNASPDIVSQNSKLNSAGKLAIKRYGKTFNLRESTIDELKYMDGQFVGYVTLDSGKKRFIKILKSGQAAAMWSNKNMKMMEKPGIRGLGTMAKSEWDKYESRVSETTESIAETTDPDVITQIRSVVAKGTAAKVKDPKTGTNVLVDLFSAGAIVSVYDKISDSNKKKLSSLSIPSMVNIVFKLGKKKK